MLCCLAILSNRLIPEPKSLHFKHFFKCVSGPMHWQPAQPMKCDPTLAQQFLKIKTMSKSLSSLGLVGSSSSLNLIVEFVSDSCSRPSLPNRSLFVCLGSSSNVLGSKLTAFKKPLQHLSLQLVPNRIWLCLYPHLFLYTVRVCFNWDASSIIWSEVKYGIPPHDIRRCHL